MGPQRVQRKRTKGWRMPENTVSCTRPGKYGNPFKVGTPMSDAEDGPTTSIMTAQQAKDMFYWNIIGTGLAEQAKKELKGKNLACFCPLDQPCHVDVLLKIANE